MDKQAFYSNINRDTYDNITELSKEFGISKTSVLECAVNENHRLLECTRKLIKGHTLNSNELNLINRFICYYGKSISSSLKVSIGKALITQLETLGTTDIDIDNVRKLIG